MYWRNLLCTMIVSLGLSITIVSPVFASVTDGLIIDQYAWSNYGGWVNFGADESDVHVTSNAITGYAWIANEGWMNLAPDNGGIINNGQGDLSGYAWNETVGWINFDSVSIDNNGVFHGNAYGPTYGTTTYTIAFDCDNCLVTTDWRKSTGGGSSGTPTGGGGGSSGGGIAVVNATTTRENNSTGLLCVYPATMPMSADINKDTKVEVFDFNRLMVNWGNRGLDPADINQDCIVDVLDFNRLMVNWSV